MLGIEPRALCAKSHALTLTCLQSLKPIFILVVVVDGIYKLMLIFRYSTCFVWFQQDDCRMMS